MDTSPLVKGIVELFGLFAAPCCIGQDGKSDKEHNCQTDPITCKQPVCQHLDDVDLIVCVKPSISTTKPQITTVSVIKCFLSRWVTSGVCGVCTRPWVWWISHATRAPSSSPCCYDVSSHPSTLTMMRSAWLTHLRKFILFRKIFFVLLLHCYIRKITMPLLL